MTPRHANECVGVTGAYGWIGSEVSRQLEARDIVVRRFARQLGSGPAVRLDLRWDVPAMQKALEGCSGIVHCAAHVHRPIENEQECATFHAVNLVGTQRLLQASALAGIVRFVFVSTIAIYDWSGFPSAQKENGNTGPGTFYGRSKSKAEAMVTNGALDWRIARLGTVFGNGDLANFARLAVALAQGRFFIPGGGEARKSVLPLNKAGTLLAELYMRNDLAKSVVNLASPAPPSLAEVCDSFGRVCGFRRAPRLPVPAMHGIARLGDIVEAITGRSPFTSEILRKLTTSTVVDVSRMLGMFPGMRWNSFEEELGEARDYYAGLHSSFHRSALRS